MSESGNFPQATNNKDQIIQIGTVFSYYGESEPYYKHMITLNGCEKISALNDVVIQSYKSERNVVLAWTKLIQEMNPDVITGYNINGFDFEYMYLRAKKIEELTKIPLVDNFMKLSKIIGETCQYKIKELSSAGLGDNLLKYIIMGGRIIIDLMKVAQRDYKLDSYKLDNVASFFIKEPIKTYKYENNTTIIGTTSIYGIKEDQYVNIIYNDGLTDNKHDNKYKILKINEKEKIIIIDGILPKELFEDGNKVSWSHGKDDISAKEMFAMFKGSDNDRAIIAKYCIQDCVLVTKLMEKLQILNNNIAMSNVCSVPLSYIFMRGQGAKIFSLVVKKCRDFDHLVPKITANNDDNEEKIGYEGATVFTPVKGVHYEPIPVLDYSSLYPKSMIFRNISHECIVLDKKYDNLPNYNYQTVTYKNNDGTNTTCKYAKKTDGTRGILCLILMELLEKRSITKKLMEQTEDKFLKNIYDGLQLAYKVTANGLYGLLGASTSPIYLKELAASTTATGREMLEFSRDFIEGPFGDLINYSVHNKQKFKTEAVKLFTGQHKLLKHTYPSIYSIAPDHKFVEPRANRKTMDDFIEFFSSTVNNVLTHKQKVQPSIIYGDSVTGDTPILLLNSDNQYVIKTIDDLGSCWTDYSAFKSDIEGLSKKKQDSNINYKVWTDKGWATIKRVIKHKTNKQIYEVLTHTGYVKVTEDHSLLDIDGKEIKPCDCKCDHKTKTSLLHCFPTIINNNVQTDTYNLNEAYIYGLFFSNVSFTEEPTYSWTFKHYNYDIISKLLEKTKYIYHDYSFVCVDTGTAYNIIPSKNIEQFVKKYKEIFYDNNNIIIPKLILNGTFHEKETFLTAYLDAKKISDTSIEISKSVYYYTNSQITAMNFYFLVRTLGYITTINKTEENFQIIFKKHFIKHDSKNTNEIQYIKKLNAINEHVNQYVYDLETDVGHFHAGVGSLIVKNTDSVFFSMKIHDIETLDIKTDKDALKTCIEFGKLAGATICKILPEPQEQIYEKTMWPLILLTKKRYVGNLYENDINKFSQKSMGIVLKRRDNAKIVKRVVGGIVNYILNERSNQGAIDYTRELIKKILRGKFEIDNFIITKTLKANYKDRTRMVHAVLADRIGHRDPGNKPGMNDRVPFVYVITKGKVNLQGERVEDPKYVIDNNLELDYLFYITNQIMKPSIQFLELISHNPEKIFNNYINKEINRRKNISSIFDYVGEKNVIETCNNVDNSSEKNNKDFEEQNIKDLQQLDIELDNKLTFNVEQQHVKKNKKKKIVENKIPKKISLTIEL
jgi:DNA polymerase elongation subunit (family B)